MTDFAKIIYVDGLQVLFWVEPDPGLDEHNTLHQITSIDGVVADVALYELDLDVGPILFTCNDERARSVVDMVRKFVG